MQVFSGSWLNWCSSWLVTVVSYVELNAPGRWQHENGSPSGVSRICSSSKRFIGLGCCLRLSAVGNDLVKVVQDTRTVVTNFRKGKISLVQWEKFSSRSGIYEPCRNPSPLWSRHRPPRPSNAVDGASLFRLFSEQAKRCGGTLHGCGETGVCGIRGWTGQAKVVTG